jgi:hypothetical protein
MRTKIWEFLCRSGKGVVTIVGTFAIIGAIIGAYTQIATSSDLEKVRQETKETIKQVGEQIQKSFELKSNIDRLNNINDTLIKARIQQRTYPRDEELKEDIDKLKEEKSKLEERIRK